MADQTPPQPPRLNPDPAPLCAFLLFVDDGGSGWGPMHARLQGDDFDELLAATPPDVPRWHIIARDTGMIVAGSNPDVDRTHGGGSSLEGQIRFNQQGASEAMWGAWLAHRTPHSSDGLHGPHDLFLDASASSVLDPNGQVLRVVPSMEQVKAHERVLSEWAFEQHAEGNEVTIDPAIEARVQAFMGDALLPSGWESLPTDELRALVEAAEATVLARTGQTPEELMQARRDAERALAGDESVEPEPDTPMQDTAP